MSSADDHDQPVYGEYKLFPPADTSAPHSLIRSPKRPTGNESICDTKRLLPPSPARSTSSQQSPPPSPVLPKFLRMCLDAKLNAIQAVIDSHRQQQSNDSSPSKASTTSSSAASPMLRSLDHQQFSALHYAVLSGNPDCVQLIVSVTDQLPDDDRTHPAFHCTALHLACKLPATTPDMLCMLIRRRPEHVNWTSVDADGRQRTPLLAALLARRTQLVRVLCDEGQADVNAMDAQGEHCLFYAVRQRMPRVACDLLRTTAVRANLLNGGGVGLLDLVDACCTAGGRDAADWQLLEALTSRLHSAVMLTPDIRRQLDLRALFARATAAVRRKDDAYVAWFVGTYYTDRQWNSVDCVQLVQSCLKLRALQTNWRYACGEVLLMPLHRQLHQPETCCEDKAAASRLVADLGKHYGQMLLCPERLAGAAVIGVLYTFWREDPLLYRRFAEQWFPVFGMCGSLRYRQDCLVTFLCQLALREANIDLDGLFEFLMGMACGRAALVMRMGDLFERFVQAGDDGLPDGWTNGVDENAPADGVDQMPTIRDNRRAELIASMLLVLCDRIDPFEKLLAAQQRPSGLIALLVPSDDRADRPNIVPRLFSLCRRRVRELVLMSAVAASPPVREFLRLPMQPGLLNLVLYNPLDYPIGCCWR